MKLINYFYSESLKFGLFFGAVRSQATTEQMTKLLEQGMLTLKGMYGCFAMTELG